MENRFQELDNILDSFSSWPFYSKSKEFSEMFDLVLPNSSFHELTDAIQNSHKRGFSYSYEFDKLRLIKLTKNENEAEVLGIIRLNMSNTDIVYEGNFISSCCKLNKLNKWMLKDIEIDWF